MIHRHTLLLMLSLWYPYNHYIGTHCCWCFHCGTPTTLTSAHIVVDAFTVVHLQPLQFMFRCDHTVFSFSSNMSSSMLFLVNLFLSIHLVSKWVKSVLVYSRSFLCQFHLLFIWFYPLLLDCCPGVKHYNELRKVTTRYGHTPFASLGVPILYPGLLCTAEIPVKGKIILLVDGKGKPPHYHP